LVLIDTPPGTAAAIDAAIDASDLVIIPTGPRPADIDRVWPTLDITQPRPTTILLTLMDMRKVEAAEIPRGLAEANAPMLRSTVRDLTRIERAFGHGIPRFLGDYAEVFDELMTVAGIDREAAKV
jgi:chromosome partitioning protein